MLGDLLKVVGKIGETVADKLFPGPEQELKRMELANALQLAALQQAGEIEVAAAGIIRSEAEGKGWLQRSWRPITMLTFVTLIVARWMGWAAPNITEAESLQLWKIVQIGLGGYVIGRSAEKIIPRAIEARGTK